MTMRCVFKRARPHTMTMTLLRPARGLFVTAALLAGYGAAGLYRTTVLRAAKHSEVMEALSHKGVTSSKAWREHVDVTYPLLGTAATVAYSNGRLDRPLDAG